MRLKVSLFCLFAVIVDSYEYSLSCFDVPKVGGRVYQDDNDRILSLVHGGILGCLWGKESACAQPFLASQPWGAATRTLARRLLTQ